MIFSFTAMPRSVLSLSLFLVSLISASVCPSVCLNNMAAACAPYHLSAARKYPLTEFPLASRLSFIPKPSVLPLPLPLPSSSRCSSTRHTHTHTHTVTANSIYNQAAPVQPSTAGQVITCKAAVCWAPSEPLVMEDIQVDPPQAGEVRIKILYTSLCLTDVTFWKDKPKLGIFPRIFGHEASGIVESVGAGVTRVKPGDHVLPIFTGECQECVHCKSVKSNLCIKCRIDTERGVMLIDKKSRFSCRGKPVYFFMGSTFSEYTVVDQGNVVKVNPEAALDKICVLSCGVTTGLGSVWKAAKVEKGSTVAIFGLGTIGLGVAEGARVAGASRIIGVDVNPAKFEKARTFGVTEFVNPRDHTKPTDEVIRDMTDGGVDYSFECVGNSKLAETALLSIHDGWGLSVICGVEGESSNMSVHPNLFLYGRSLTGAFFGGIKPISELPDIVDMYMKKELQLDEFITHELPFSQINEAFKLMMEGKGLRTMMRVQEE